MAPRLDEGTCASDVPLLILGSMPVAHGTQTRKSPACRPRDPDSRSRDRDPRSRPNRATGDFRIPDSGRVGNRGFPPRFPAKSEIGGTEIADFRV